MDARRPATVVVLLGALILAGCGRSGYGTVDTRQLVLIETARPASAAAQRADDALACAARAQARRLHKTLTVQRPRNGSASAQIAIANAVTADKPGGVVIVPVAPNPLLAPILSMRRAGIKVVRLTAPATPAAAAAQGARAVARAVAEVDPRDRDGRAGETNNLLDRCASVH